MTFWSFTSHLCAIASFCVAAISMLNGQPGEDYVIVGLPFTIIANQEEA